MLQHVMSITLLAALATATPAPSQIRGTISGTSRAPLPKLLVANPVLATSGDSGASVTVGDGLRERLTKQLSSSYAVVSRRDMNTALATFGFGADELLSASAARLLANSVTAQILVTSTMHRGTDGRFQLVVRVISATGTTDAGHVVTISQTAGQPLVDLGSKAADAIVPAIKAWNDAKSCFELSSTKPDKAQEAAAKAFKSQPGHGLASYCLAELASRKDSVGPTTLSAWQDVVKSDPLSLSAWSQVGFIYSVQKDSAKVIETFQQMLRVAPTNQALRDRSYELFRAYGRPEAAMQVVDEGIRLDPANTDWYDLKSNICLGQGDFGCAIASLEEVYAVDSTKADTSFYAKMLYAVKAKPDTAKYVLWSKRGAKKYDNRADVLEELAIAYGWAGQPDSSVEVAKRMIMLDDTKSTALMRVVQALVEGKHFRMANALAPTVRRLTDQDAKDNYAGILIPVADGLRSAEPLDNELLAETSEAILSVSSTNPNVNIFANFFLAAALRPQVVEMSTAMRAASPAPTCEMARRYAAVLQRIEPALVSAGTSTTAGVANFAKQLLPSVQSERPWVDQQIPKLCK